MCGYNIVVVCVFCELVVENGLCEMLCVCDVKFGDGCVCVVGLEICDEDGNLID